MLFFIPAWYQENEWCENEQFWYTRRTRTEFDDTVKQIQLFHRSQAYPFQVMLLSHAPNYRHFLHRQSVFHAPYWSCFDAIQEIRKKKVRIFSFRNLNWPEHIEFIYSPFVVVAMLHGEKYAQVEFGEDGNMIQIDLYQQGKLVRKNVYDDRGFISTTTIYEDGQPLYTDYLNENGIWKIRRNLRNQGVSVNPKLSTYLIEHGGKEEQKNFNKSHYDSLEEIIYEVLCAYLEQLDEKDMFCVAMHPHHLNLLTKALKDKKTILSFFETRFNLEQDLNQIPLVQTADYIIADKQSTLKRTGRGVDITPFDSRVDFGISQQISVQKILVPVDNLGAENLRKLIIKLGEYLPTNKNARIHLFTRKADYNRKKNLLLEVQEILREAGMEESWAMEESKGFGENQIDEMEEARGLFVVEQCVDELAVSTCMREQRLIVDMREKTELYLRIAGISVGIPQIVYKDSQFVEDGKNGLVLKDYDKLSEAIRFYLDSLNNWNEAMVYSYELGKKYTTAELIEKWKEVIRIVSGEN